MQEETAIRIAAALERQNELAEKFIVFWDRLLAMQEMVLFGRAVSSDPKETN